MDEECIFCKVGGGEIPADILYRDEHCFVIRDIAPKPESTEGGRGVSVLKRRKGAPVHLG